MINKELKTIIISGGLGLLGREFAKTLSRGYNVILLDTPNKVDSYYEGGETHYFYVVSCDITDEKQVKEIIEGIYDAYGINLLINCAAYNEQPDENIDNSFENYSLDRWKKTLDVNLTGSFLLSRECIQYMLTNKNEGFKGTIVNIASDLGIIASDQSIYENGYKKPPGYGVSKAGLIYLTKYIAGYYRDKIKSVCLAPGSVYSGQSDVLKKNLEDRIPIGRLARANEYNEAIKFLCSSGSDYFQGGCLTCAGGRDII